MNKLIALGLTALVCCVTLAYGFGGSMYPMYPGPMVYPGGGAGFSAVGQGGIMEFFFMMIFLMFMMQIFRDFGDGDGGNY